MKGKNNMNIIHKLKIKYLRGSYSVEAALIVPIIFGMLFAMLYVLFFLHDKAVLYGNMNRELTLVCEGEREYTSDMEWQKAMQENLWILRVDKGKLSKGKLQVSGSAVACSEWDIPVMGNFLSRKQKLKQEIKRSNILPSEVLWGKTLLKSEEDAD